MNPEPTPYVVLQPFAGRLRRGRPRVGWLVGLWCATGAVATDAQTPVGDISGPGTSGDGAFAQHAVDGDAPGVPTGSAKGGDSAPSIRKRAAQPERTMRRRAARSGESAGRATSGLERRGTAWYQTGIGSLGIVLALLGGVFYCARKWVPIARTAENKAMRVVARASVSPKQSVALVQLGRRFVMVGVSPDRMSILSVISDHDEVADLAQATGVQGASRGPAFERLLQRESEDFLDHDEPESVTAAKDPIRDVGGGTGEALTDLLHRLRRLHSG